MRSRMARGQMQRGLDRGVERSRGLPRVLMGLAGTRHLEATVSDPFALPVKLRTGGGLDDGTNMVMMLDYSAFDGGDVLG